MVEHGHVRDEREQAAEVGALLDLCAAECVDGAFVHDFIAPGSPCRAVADRFRRPAS
ncbi:hypothetical protein ACXNSR_32085 [Streptomyces sp. NC-S4]